MWTFRLSSSEIAQWNVGWCSAHELVRFISCTQELSLRWFRCRLASSKMGKFSPNSMRKSLQLHSFKFTSSNLVGGLEHQFYFRIYWVANHPNWLSYFSEGWLNHQPDLNSLLQKMFLSPKNHWFSPWTSCTKTSCTFFDNSWPSLCLPGISQMFVPALTLKCRVDTTHTMAFSKDFL